MRAVGRGEGAAAAVARRYDHPPMASEGQTALARGWGLISARAVPKVHSFERRIIMPG